MKKVFIVHGLGGRPNGGWRPWLMAELAKKDTYACALSMPDPEEPVCAEWVGEIERHVGRSLRDEVYLVGHSLGVAAILRYLEAMPEKHKVSGAVLVSGRCEKPEEGRLPTFYEVPLDFGTIRSGSSKFAVIHGDDDAVVPVSNAEMFARELGCEPIIVRNGGHLNGSSGRWTLPQCMEALDKMMSG